MGRTGRPQRRKRWKECLHRRTRALTQHTEKDESGATDTALVRSEVQGCPSLHGEFKASMGDVLSQDNKKIKREMCDRRRDLIRAAS